MERAAREIYFKSPRKDTAGTGSGAGRKLNRSSLPSPPNPLLNFPLTILFKIHGLSYLFLGMIIVIAQSLPKLLQNLDEGANGKHKMDAWLPGYQQEHHQP